MSDWEPAPLPMVSQSGWEPAPVPMTPKPVGAAMSVNNPPPAMGPQQPADVPRPWSEQPGNILPSIGHAAGNFYDAITHPIDTGTNLVKLGVGALDSLPHPYMTEARQRQVAENTSPEMTAARAEGQGMATNAGNALDQRYGNLVRLRNTMITDPAGFALDLASIATPFKGGAILDPLTQAGNALKLSTKVPEAIGSHALGVSTGAGPEAVRLAGRAGLEGGDIGKAFTDNMRGNVPITDIVNRAKSALGEMRQERGAAYRSGMSDISKDKTVLDFGPIEDAAGKASEIGTFKGVTVNRSASETNGKIADIVNEWKALDPAEYHTPEGLDALKRTIGDLRDSTEQGTPARVAADRVYNAVKAQIQDQAPAYAKVMEGYSKASEGLKEATRTFSLGERATGDTAARKLTSALRNNVQTNFGERARLLNVLAEKDATLPAAIAGQSLNSLAPRGLPARGGMTVMASTAIANPAHLLMLPGFSPRIVGETVYLGGKAIGKVDDIANALHITPQNLRLLEQGGFQAGQNNALQGNPYVGAH